MAEKFIVNTDSVSQSAIKADLEAWLQTLPDADQWTLYFESATGQAVIELIAAMMTYMKFDSITARREAFLQFALNASSQIAASQSLGYSVFRGRNAIVKLNITPINTGIWPKYEILGTVKDRDLILLEDTPYNAGVPIDVTLVVGSLETQDLVADVSSLDVFRFNQKLVSEDLRISIDGTEVETSKNVVDMLDGKFQLQSNPFGSVDAKYLNLLAFPTRYNVGSILQLEWVTLKDTIFVTSDLALDETEGTLNAVEVTSLFEPVETENSIKVNAPLQNETKFVIRAREDQPKILTQVSTDIIDAKGRDISAAIMILFYMRDDDFRFTETEVNGLINQMAPYRPHGMLPVLIGHPQRIGVRLKIDVTLSGVTGDPVTDIRAITQALAFKLQGSIILSDLEASIEALDTVKIVRISFTGDTWLADTKYEVGTHVKASPDNGKIYQAEEILYFSGGGEPTWPAVINEEVTDGDIIWIAVPKDDPSGIPDWEASTSYTVNTEVRPTTPNGFIFKVKETLNESDSVEPTWPPLSGGLPKDHAGTKVNDGNLVWVARELDGTPSAWAADTVYRVGDLVEATDTGASDTVGVMWQAYTYLGQSDNSQPTFPTIVGNSVVDNNLKWVCQESTNDINTLDEEQYYTITEEFALIGS